MASPNVKSPAKRRQRNSRSKITASKPKGLTKKQQSPKRTYKPVSDYTDVELRENAINRAESRLHDIAESCGLDFDTTDNIRDQKQRPAAVDIGLRFEMFDRNNPYHRIRFRGETDQPLLDAMAMVTHNLIDKCVRLLGTLEGTSPQPLQRGVYIARDRSGAIVETSLYGWDKTPKGASRVEFKRLPSNGAGDVGLQDPEVEDTDDTLGQMVFAIVAGKRIKRVFGTLAEAQDYANAMRDASGEDFSHMDRLRMTWVNFPDGLRGLSGGDE